jgi:hypothetical protein
MFIAVHLVSTQYNTQAAAWKLCFMSFWNQSKQQKIFQFTAKNNDCIASVEDVELSYVKSEYIRHERMYHEQLQIRSSRDAYMYQRKPSG